MALAMDSLHGLKDSAKKFAGLMSLYETNYIRFMQLVSDLDGVGEQARSVRRGAITLHLNIIDRSRYTTTCHLTYRLDLGDRVITTPDMTLRLYHDAAQAEVLDCCPGDTRSFGWLDRNACQSNLQWRWRTNRFLFHWLNYCLQQGHGFPSRQCGKSFQQLKNELTNLKK